MTERRVALPLSIVVRMSSKQRTICDNSRLPVASANLDILFPNHAGPEESGRRMLSSALDSCYSLHNYPFYKDGKIVCSALGPDYSLMAKAIKSAADLDIPPSTLYGFYPCPKPDLIYTVQCNQEKDGIQEVTMALREVSLLTEPHVTKSLGVLDACVSAYDPAVLDHCESNHEAMEAVSTVLNSWYNDVRNSTSSAWWDSYILKIIHDNIDPKYGSANVLLSGMRDAWEKDSNSQIYLKANPWCDYSKWEAMVKHVLTLLGITTSVDITTEQMLLYFKEGFIDKMGDIIQEYSDRVESREPMINMIHRWQMKSNNLMANNFHEYKKITNATLAKMAEVLSDLNQKYQELTTTIGNTNNPAGLPDVSKNLTIAQAINKSERFEVFEPQFSRVGNNTITMINTINDTSITCDHAVWNGKVNNILKYMRTLTFEQANDYDMIKQALEIRNNSRGGKVTRIPYPPRPMFATIKEVAQEEPKSSKRPHWIDDIKEAHKQVQVFTSRVDVVVASQQPAVVAAGPSVATGPAVPLESSNPPPTSSNENQTNKDKAPPMESVDW